MADDKSETDKELNTESQNDAVDQGADAPSAPEMHPPAGGPEPPAVPPPLPHEHEVQEVDGRHWPTLLLYLAMALIAALLIVLAARTIYRAIHNPKPVKNPPSNDVPKPPAEKPAKNNKPKSSTPNTAAMPDTGPGDTIAIFVGVSAAVAGLHYIIALRKTKLN